VLNEAEITLAPFLEDLKQGKPKHIYSTAGLDPVPYADLHTTPAPLWDLIDIKIIALSISSLLAVALLIAIFAMLLPS
jgi:hypothetical protein